MTRTLPRTAKGLVLLLVLGGGLLAADPAKPADKSPPLPDLSEYKTVEKAVTTRISMASPTAVPGQPGYLGLNVNPGPGGKLVVADVGIDSPAAKAGLRKGDVVARLDGREVVNAGIFRELLHAKNAGDAIKLAVERQNKPMELTATLAAVSRPMKVSRQRAVIGVRVEEPKEGKGVVIAQIVPGSAAAKAKLKVGEVILKVDGVALTEPEKLRDVLAEKKPNDTVTVTLFLAEKAVDLKVQLGAEEVFTGRGRGWDSRAGGPWKKDLYRLAVVCVEYPDVKHNAKITAKDWTEALFSKGTYVKKNSVTGQPVHGSLNDYYLEQSFGKLRVEGKVFNWVEVSKKRAEYAQTIGGGPGGNRSALLTEALDKLLARDGKDALKDFDGIFFMYAGNRVQTNRGGLYWPHRASLAYQGKRWAYFICPEGGSRMADLSVACHEFGHMLGLPDLYARPENPGSEGVGAWCAMSEQAPRGRPQHFSAWCKEQLSWIQPAVIDPTVKQKLILAPINDSPKECLKVLVKPDGSEYLLLENRRKKGFDQSLPAEGLLIWRVVGRRPILEESHGVEGPAGPRVFAGSVPYPSGANDAFTPFTTPSSRSQLAGGLPVHITNIRKLADGRIAFHIGYEYQ